jgi:hypothetical protein
MPRTLNNRAQPARIPSHAGWEPNDLSNNFARLARRQDQQFEHMPYILGSKTVSTGTGSATAETILHQIRFRAGMMGVTGAIRVQMGGTTTNTADTRTVKLYFGDGSGGGAGDQEVLSTTAAGGTVLGPYALTVIIANQNDQAVQIATSHGAIVVGATTIPFVSATARTVNTAVTPTGNNTATALALTVTGQTANAGDEVTSYFLIAELLPIIP